MAEKQTLVTFNSLLTKLQKLPSFENPSIAFEQYQTPDELITELLLLASFTFNDVRDKRIIDLGCGTGKIGLGAAMLGAARVLLIDISEKAIKRGKAATQDENWTRLDWLIQPVETLVARKFYDNFDTIFMNPPFGAQRKGIDQCFIRKALVLAPVVYSIQTPFTPLLKDLERDRRIKTTKLRDRFLKIPKLHHFHQKESYQVKVSIYRYSC